MSSAHEELLDRIEIHELRAAYSRAIDHENYHRATEIFTDDAIVDYRGDVCHGGEEVMTYWQERVHYEFSLHTAQMPEISIDGDEATGKWYMAVFYVTPDGDQGWVLGGYEDEYRRVGEDWKIAGMDTEITHDTGGYHT